jgi:hypothetical protein
MRKETQRLRALAGQISEGGISEKRKGVSPKEASAAPIEAHAPHGERGEYLKITATLSPEAYDLVLAEMRRRKLARLPNAQMSAILREAVVAYLGGKG